MPPEIRSPKANYFEEIDDVETASYEYPSPGNPVDRDGVKYVDFYQVTSIHSKSDKVCGLCFSVSKNLRKKCVNCDKEFGVNGAFFENILCFNVFIEKLSND